MCRRKLACQEEADVEVPRTLLHRLTFGVQDAGRRRSELTEQEQVAVFDLFHAYASQPLPPARGHIEFRVGQYPEVRADLSRWKFSFQFNGQADETVFLAILDPCY